MIVVWITTPRNMSQFSGVIWNSTPYHHYIFLGNLLVHLAICVVDSLQGGGGFILQIHIVLIYSVTIFHKCITLQNRLITLMATINSSLTYLSYQGDSTYISPLTQPMLPYRPRSIRQRIVIYTTKKNKHSFLTFISKSWLNLSSILYMAQGKLLIVCLEYHGK